MRRTCAAATLLTLTAALALPSASTAASKEIRITKSKTIAGVGDFRPNSNAYVGAAASVFGAPTAVKASGSAGCDVRWSELGLRITFANFGAPDRSACEADIGRAQVIQIGGAKAAGWHTNRGLYIGAKRSTMFKKYDQRRTGPGRYSLVRRASPFGPPGTIQEILGARISNGKVSSFVVSPFAAGD